MPAKLDRVTLQWLAGFFDGEGCVGVYSSHEGRYHITVTISQKNYGILAEIKRLHPIFGGPYPSRTRRGSFTITVNGRRGIEFLEAIEPFLVLKADQVALAIKTVKTAWSDTSSEPWQEAFTELKRMKKEEDCKTELDVVAKQFGVNTEALEKALEKVTQ